jgi:hypothetical protein
MKQNKFLNQMNGEIFICEDTRVVDTIDGVDYLLVKREDSPRVFKMRRDVLRPLNNTVSKSKTKHFSKL